MLPKRKHVIAKEERAAHTHACSCNCSLRHLAMAISDCVFICVHFLMSLQMHFRICLCILDHTEPIDRDLLVLAPNITTEDGASSCALGCRCTTCASTLPHGRWGALHRNNFAMLNFLVYIKDYSQRQCLVEILQSNARMVWLLDEHPTQIG